MDTVSFWYDNFRMVAIWILCRIDWTVSQWIYKIIKLKLDSKMLLALNIYENIKVEIFKTL